MVAIKPTKLNIYDFSHNSYERLFRANCPAEKRGGMPRNQTTQSDEENLGGGTLLKRMKTCLDKGIRETRIRKHEDGKEFLHEKQGKDSSKRRHRDARGLSDGKSRNHHYNRSSR